MIVCFEINFFHGVKEGSFTMTQVPPLPRGNTDF